MSLMTMSSSPEMKPAAKTATERKREERRRKREDIGHFRLPRSLLRDILIEERTLEEWSENDDAKIAEAIIQHFKRVSRCDASE